MKESSMRLTIELKPEIVHVLSDYYHAVYEEKISDRELAYGLQRLLEYVLTPCDSGRRMDAFDYAAGQAWSYRRREESDGGEDIGK